MKNLKRRWSTPLHAYIIEDLDWIKKKIVEKYDNDMRREMLLHIDKSSYGSTGYIFFSIVGSPPKGCAIYQHDHKFLIIICYDGTIRKFNDVMIDSKLLDVGESC